MTLAQKSHLTFKANMGVSRHGWLRLTPAYSYKLVKDSLRDADKAALVLDPFAGTGTTGLVAAESGMDAVMLDLNPFLVWLGRAKCQELLCPRYFRRSARVCPSRSCAAKTRKVGMALRFRRCTRWNGGGTARTLRGLAALKQALDESNRDTPADDLAADSVLPRDDRDEQRGVQSSVHVFPEVGESGQVGMFALGAQV